MAFEWEQALRIGDRIQGLVLESVNVRNNGLGSTNVEFKWRNDSGKPVMPMLGDPSRRMTIDATDHLVIRAPGGLRERIAALDLQHLPLHLANPDGSPLKLCLGSGGRDYCWAFIVAPCLEYRLITEGPENEV